MEPHQWMRQLAQRLQMLMNNYKGNVWRVAGLVTITFLIFVLIFNSDLVDNKERRFQDDDVLTGNSKVKKLVADWSQESHVESSKVRRLLDSLRGLTLLAAEGADYTLTAEAREAWYAQNPCKSRSELPQMYALRKHVRKLSPNPLWDRVLDEYSNLHRTCMTRVGNNLTDYFHNVHNASIPGCKFLIGEGTNGLGNKLLVTVSAVLYAIVSQRVLLVPAWTNLDSLLCEPFVGSSWMLDGYLFPMPRSKFGQAWEPDNQFTSRMHGRLYANCSESAQCGRQPLPPLMDAVIVSAGFANWEPRHWFYCNTEQTFLSEIPWLYFSGCIDSIPKIVGSPAFSSTVKPLFPDNMVITRLLRSTLLPSDIVWNRFKHLNRAYFQQADRRVAIQLRFFGNHEKMGTVMNDRVVDCVLNNGILPNVSASMATNINDTTAKESSSSNFTLPYTTLVYIASLYNDLYARLNDMYLRTLTVTGEDVGLVQLTSQLYQSKGREEDTEAMVEVLLLSMSDTLLVTPVSTFGGLGQAYGGLIPWIIRASGEGNVTSCERGQAVDVCQPGASPDYHCPNDPPPPPSTDGQFAHEQKPSLIGRCLDIDVHGAQVLDN